MSQRLCELCGNPIDTSKKHWRTHRFCSKTCANRCKWPEVRADNVMSFVTVDHVTGCWNWNGSKTRVGYGVKVQGGKKYMAHRLIYFVLKGVWSEERCGCHHCDNPSCCNPDHIFFGSHKDNTADCFAKGRMPLGSRKVHAKLTETEVCEIRRRAAIGESSRCLGPIFGVSPRQIRKVVHGDQWRHVHV